MEQQRLTNPSWMWAMLGRCASRWLEQWPTSASIEVLQKFKVRQPMRSQFHGNETQRRGRMDDGVVCGVQFGVVCSLFKHPLFSLKKKKTSSVLCLNLCSPLKKKILCSLFKRSRRAQVQDGSLQVCIPLFLNVHGSEFDVSVSTFQHALRLRKTLSVPRLKEIGW